MFIYPTEVTINFHVLHTKAGTLSLKNESLIEYLNVKGENWIGQRGSVILAALPLPKQRLNQTRNYVLKTKLANK